ncbi:MAG TPA: hydroxymethylbilane synthase [Vicinamibacterales bacterium]|jgi:hydroxymethylbilane synthase|nr:hydroxymethylbilane synthase [Vicinamibacterales bacterium]
MNAVRLGTRGSQLALWQARAVGALLGQRGHAVEIIVIKTSGDRLQDSRLAEVGGKGLFVKEIEEALERGDIDAAVHSAKDMPAVLPGWSVVAAALPREDPRDALVLPRTPETVHISEAVARIGDSPTIGTSSIRRIAQLSMLLPRARFEPVRGNVDTRLRKLDAGGFDALVLAAAGMKRLGFSSRITAAIPTADCIPAPGQGIVAIEVRADDRRIRSAAEAINDEETAAALDAERAVVAALGGGCQLPLGAIAERDGVDLTLQAIVASIDGRRSVKRSVRGPAARPGDLGRRLADELARAGASAILDGARAAHRPLEGSY